MKFKPLDVQAMHRQFTTAEPFPFVVIDDFLERDEALEIAAAFPTYESTARHGQEYVSVNERRKAQLQDLRLFPEPLKRLSDALHSPEWLATVAQFSGIPEIQVDNRLMGGGIHQTRRGGRLDVHADFNYLPDVEMFRRLNLLLYLNPRWEDSWGGELELWNRDMTRCVHSIKPVLGRCVIFATSVDSYHGTTRIRCPKDVTRKSFAVYYYSFAPPPGFNNDFQSTVFKARPNERLKRLLLMPLSSAYHGAAWHGRRLSALVRSKLGHTQHSPPPSWEFREKDVPSETPPGKPGAR